ncbi:MAG: LPS assembly protein LptD, partial [Gammaproteobacteria bacterium]|nr:LPS assembly protein LptD [Gammaproteobacteria bacterium]
VPTIRSTSNTGFDVTVPYYFNLAPNYDATMAVRPMTKRGVQLQGEYRYLQEWGEGLLAGETLPSDDEYGEARNAVRFYHTGRFAPRWYANVNFEWVSDEDYFTDLGTNLALSSQTFLDRRADLTYGGDWWYGLARVQSFQSLDSTLAPQDKPYERLPQLYAAMSRRERNVSLNPTGHVEGVFFERSDSVTGTRLDFKPGLSFPVRRAAWFAVPHANVRFTQYNLENTGPGQPADPSRVIPTFSFDTGAFFERDWASGGGGLLQTLEPRLFYLYVPFDNQDDLPVFDTSEFDFSFGQLFRENRFTSADRVGDANQLSIALTSRLLTTRSGDELLSVGIGQIYYFEDREVTLPDQPVETGSRSPLVAQLGASLGRSWRFLGAIQWDPEESQTERNSVGLRYQPDPRRVVNLSYRFVRGDFEQSDVSFAWPLARDWRVVARWNYALDTEENLEIFGGLEYESCCWAFRTIARRYLSGPGGEQSDGFFIQLEFKGLTGIGRSTVDFLERSIPGYENEF